MISYFAEDITFPDIDKRATSEWIKQIAALYDKRVGAISYVFCSDDYILNVNNQHLQHDYYTDIITFDYSKGSTIAGDVFVSLDTVRSNAVLYNQQYDDELSRVIIHGILHLCGQGDKTEDEEKEMRRKEDNALKRKTAYEKKSE